MNIIIASRPEISIYKSPWGPFIITQASLKKQKETQVLSCPVPGNSFHSVGGSCSVDQLFADAALWISLLTGASPSSPLSPALMAENDSSFCTAYFSFISWTAGSGEHQHTWSSCEQRGFICVVELHPTCWWGPSWVRKLSPVGNQNWFKPCLACAGSSPVQLIC